MRTTIWILGFIGLLTIAQGVDAGVFTKAINAAPGQTSSSQLFVETNQVLRVLHAKASGSSAKWIVQTVGATNQYDVSSVKEMVVAGPATILFSVSPSAVGSPPPDNAMWTFDLSNAFDFTPSSSVVVPSDSGGPVTIILESSVDLISWTTALPGAYGTTTTNRFFRVRASR